MQVRNKKQIRRVSGAHTVITLLLSLIQNYFSENVQTLVMKFISSNTQASSTNLSIRQNVIKIFPKDLWSWLGCRLYIHSVFEISGLNLVPL